MLYNFFKQINHAIIHFLESPKVIPITLGVLFFIMSVVTRIVLIIASQEETTLIQFFLIFFFGFLYDTTVIIWFLIPLLLYFTWIPIRWHSSSLHRKVTGSLFLIGILILLSVPFIEYFFWVEYKARLNFVAMDYLVYPVEVISFIWESYPVLSIVSIILVLIIGIIYLLHRLGWIEAFLQSKPPERTSKYRRTLIIALTLTISIFIAFYIRTPQNFSIIQQELSHNGAFSLSKTVYFCLHDYHYSYLTLPQEQIIHRIKDLTQSPTRTYIKNQDFFNLYYREEKQGAEKYPNVILIIMESFDAAYMKRFGNIKNITPNFDSLVDKSLFFDNFYASAIRTVGGMESITTSRPTLAKFSLLKRDYSIGVTTLAKIFNQKGYQSTFIYPGDSHFDNQKVFFSNNGYNVLDIKDLLLQNKSLTIDNLNQFLKSLSPETSSDEIKNKLKNIINENHVFKTTWGVCDEEMLNWVIANADKHHTDKQPFFTMAMTCSNHIPFDFPANKVSLPVKTAEGSMQYADYAIGEFLKKAQTKPWFSNTVFVFVADHCTHKSDAESDMSPCNFHIPLFIYSANPNFVKPQIISTIGSQTDIAPTLFSLFNWSYQAEFLGQDLLTIPHEKGRALLATFKTLGLYQKDIVTYLIPLMDKEKGYNILQVKADKTTIPITQITPEIKQQLYDNKAYYQISEEFYAQRFFNEKRKKRFSSSFTNKKKLPFLQE